ncbi:universal stress protein [Nocardioides plantarum]|uniref:Universal stress protein n=1 Tax=Nocardioides plantarum TaxID=29299 RepID=A0ABV5K8K6_9ACTN|nr:universal stress protein [Nocardioides plantarum]
MNVTSKPIVVAVADRDCRALLDFAAAEAVADRCTLHLVHVVRTPPSLPESFAMAYQAAEEYGARVVADVVDATKARVDGAVPVTAELVTRGDPVEVLVERSADARMVLTQHRRLMGVRRVTSSSTTSGVAAHAHAPVVSVPESWRQPVEVDRPVLVGVNEPGRSRGVLRAAFEMAANRAVDVHVVHTWWLANGYDSLVVDAAMRVERERQFEQELGPELEVMKGDYPGVAVGVSVIHAPAAVALTDAADSAGIVVLGRRHHTLAVGSHLGAVVRTVLRHSAVPVMVVEPSETTAGTGGRRR